MDNLRIRSIETIITPTQLKEKYRLSDKGQQIVSSSRQEIADIISGKSNKVLVVVGPCSIDDSASALKYAEWLKEQKDRFQDELLIVMRTYFEKPRTTVGWKGLIYDPHLDGSGAMEEGLHIARKLLLDIIETYGLPVAVEFLDTISPQYIADLISWGAIGARTTESQLHRELASGLSMPIGFKNGTDGGIQIAIDAMGAAAGAHSFLGATESGSIGLVNTIGNPDTHIVLRGGKGKPNYTEDDVQSITSTLHGKKINPRIMIDASHENSGKDHKNQSVVGENIAKQIASGNTEIMGIMLESNLIEGAQSFTPGKDDPTERNLGQSITDKCMGLSETARILGLLATAQKTRKIVNGIQ